jgi:hypothetical protein
VKCGVWRAKDKEASLPSAKDEEERDFEHYNLFIVKLGLISLKLKKNEYFCIFFFLTTFSDIYRY